MRPTENLANPVMRDKNASSKTQFLLSEQLWLTTSTASYYLFRAIG